MGERQCAMEGLDMSPEFWRGRRVFVTGHTGFKGSWLSLWLGKLGAEVTGYALAAPTQPNLFEVAQVNDIVRSIIGDIRDKTTLKNALVQAKPEIVIHMAAQPLVRYSYREPLETYETNVMGTANLLEAVRYTSTVRAVINVTSDKCYENREWPWSYRENESMGGYDPYSSSKGCAELITAAYRQSYFNPSEYTKHGVAIASARAGNVIGGGDWAVDRLIPDIIRAIDAGQPVSIRSPHAIRPWQHVLEALGGYLSLAENLYARGPRYSEAWNFGPQDDDAKPVQWIVEQITREWGDGASWQLETEASHHEAHYLKLDSSKARALLQWSPRWRLSETLSSIVAWHKALVRRADMKGFTIDQISTYETRRNH